MATDILLTLSCYSQDMGNTINKPILETFMTNAEALGISTCHHKVVCKC